jgi:hypothetical protein
MRVGEVDSMIVEHESFMELRGVAARDRGRLGIWSPRRFAAGKSKGMVRGEAHAREKKI